MKRVSRYIYAYPRACSTGITWIDAGDVDEYVKPPAPSIIILRSFVVGHYRYNKLVFIRAATWIFIILIQLADE